MTRNYSRPSTPPKNEDGKIVSNFTPSSSMNDSRSSTPPKNKDGKIVSDFTPPSSMFEYLKSIDRTETEIDRTEREDKLHQLAEKNSATTLRSRTWENLLEANFFIGENHQDINPKKFLIQNMQLLADSGYSVIFMEHLWGGLQDDLTGYLGRGGRETPEQLKMGLDRVTEGYLSNTADFLEVVEKDKAYNKAYKYASETFNYNAIVREAARVEIKVIPLEISEENYESFPRGADRMIYLNSNAVDVVTREVAANPELKYVGFVGSGHLLQKHGIPGICEALGVQDVVIADTRIPDMSLGTLHGTLPRVIYDRENAAGGSVCLENSTMGLAMDLSENLDYREGILPFYNTSKTLKLDSSQEKRAAESTTPSSAITNLHNPVNPFKQQKKSPTKSSI